MPVDYIAYFKSLVEHDPSAERWVIWWERHKDEMATLVPRGVYLGLTSPLDEQHYRAVFAALEAAGFRYPRPRLYRHPKIDEPNPIPATWLKQKTTLAEFEKLPWPPMMLESALYMIANFRQDDEVWTFCSPPPTWQKLMGRSGFAFVRDGVPYDHLPTMMN